MRTPSNNGRPTPSTFRSMSSAAYPPRSADDMSATNHVLPQYINPQHTEILYEDQLEQCYSAPSAPNSLSSPFLSTPTSSARTHNVNFSDASTYVTEPSSASSTGSSAGFLTPCSSSNASSRRHSMIIPEGQQHFFSAVPQTPNSPTPGARRMNNKHPIGQDSSPLNSSFSSYVEPLCSPPHSLANESLKTDMVSNDLLMDIDVYQTKINDVDWHYSNCPSDQISHFDQGVHADVACLSLDLAAGFDACMSSHMDLPHLSEVKPSMAVFHSTLDRHRALPSHFKQIQAPALAEPFEPLPRDTVRPSRSMSPSFPSSPRPRLRSSLSSVRRSRVCKNSDPRWKVPVETYPAKSNHHKCSKCPNSFNRIEHLRRHEKKHLPEGKSNMLPCYFDDCKKKIKDRSDNMRAHLQTTHFHYGKTERGGKNQRYSMKASMEKGLKSEDARWTLLLEDGIEFGDTKTGHWKMLGYSIKETRDLKVKDLVPEWEGSEDVTLKDFDPRWKKLLAGDMTFAQAMERGRWMLEQEKEGLLGVDMMTSREMGLVGVDPRWIKLLDGGMSIETAEILGVKHLLPAVAGGEHAIGIKPEL